MVQIAWINYTAMLAHHFNGSGYSKLLIGKNTVVNFTSSGVLWYVRGRQEETDTKPAAKLNSMNTVLDWTVVLFVPHRVIKFNLFFFFFFFYSCILEN
jgi:hypothetical protein